MSEARSHVIFGPSAAGTLKQALLIAQRPDEVLYAFDNFSFGPIATDDAETRVRWVEDKLRCTGWRDVTDSSAAFLAAFDSPITSVTAWISRRETWSYAGYLWWLSHIGYAPISVIEVAKLSIMNAKQMVEILDRAVPLSTEDRKLHQARWEQLKIENAPLRVIASEGLVSAQIDHFDDSLLSHATFEWQKMARIVASALVEFIDTGVHQASDLVLCARLADLAEAGRLEWRGDLSHMQRCELRLPTP
jgi:hypothetical protein